MDRVQDAAWKAGALAKARKAPVVNSWAQLCAGPHGRAVQRLAWQPHPYQLRAVKFLLGHAAAGLWLPPGLGKTSIVAAAIKSLKQARNFRRALVVAPLRVAQLTWPAELAKWQDFSELSWTLLHGRDKHKLLKEKADIDLINPEGLAWLMTNAKPWPWDVLVMDESTKFKNWSAQRTKLLRSVIGRFNRRWGMTGTPAPNGLEDLFSQVYLLDGGQALGPYITAFRNQFMIQGGYLGYEWLPRDGAWDQVAERLKPLVMRLDEKDYLQLPELVINDIEVVLPPEAKQQYKRLEKDFFLKLKQGDVVAVNAAALSIKLRQATNGSVYVEGGAAEVLHTAKLEALEDLSEELGSEPLLIAVSFLSEVEAIRQRLGKDIPYLGGGITHGKADEIVSKWNGGRLPRLLVHPTSVSHGLNLQEAACHMCWFGLTWNLEEYDQLIRRIWRQGQKQRVIVHRLLARGTVDHAVAAALAGKDKSQARLLAMLRNYMEDQESD